MPYFVNPASDPLGRRVHGSEDFAWVSQGDLYEDRSLLACEDRDGEMVPCEIHTREITSCEEV